jgi:hypothetical protein
MSRKDQNPTTEHPIAVETDFDRPEPDRNQPPANGLTYPWHFEPTFLGPILR